MRKLLKNTAIMKPVNIKEIIAFFEIHYKDTQIISLLERLSKHPWVEELRFTHSFYRVWVTTKDSNRVQLVICSKELNDWYDLWYLNENSATGLQPDEDENVIKRIDSKQVIEKLKDWIYEK